MLRRSLLCRHEWSEIARMVSAYVPSYHTPLDLICNHLPEELATYVRRDAAAFFLRNPDLYDVVTHPRFGHTGTYIRYIGSLTDSPQENVDSKIDTSHSLRVDYKEYYIDPDTLLHLSLLLPNEYVTIMPATRKQIIYRRIPPLLSRSCAWKLSEIGAMYPKLFDVWDERTGQNCAVRMRSRVSQRTAFGKVHTSFMLSNILIVLKFIRAYVEQHQQSPSSQHSLSTPMQPVSLAILEETVRSDPRISNLMQDCIALPLARFLSYYSDTFTLTRDGNGVTVPIYAQNLEPQKLLTWFRPASVGALQDYLATHRDRLIPLVEQGPEGFVSRARPKSQKWGKKRRKEARDLVGVVTEEEARTLIKEIIEKIPVDETISFNTDLLPKLDNTLLLKTRSHSMSTIRFLKKFPELVIVEEHRGDHTVRRSVTEIPSEGVTTESVVKTEQGEAGDNIYMDVDTLIQVVLLDLERSPGTFKSIAGVNSSLPAPARKAVKTVYGTLSKFVESHSKYFIVKKVGDTKLISKAENDTVDNSLERNDLNF